MPYQCYMKTSCYRITLEFQCYMIQQCLTAPLIDASFLANCLNYFEKLVILERLCYSVDFRFIPLQKLFLQLLVPQTHQPRLHRFPKATKRFIKVPEHFFALRRFAKGQAITTQYMLQYPFYSSPNLAQSIQNYPSLGRMQLGRCFCHFKN